MTKREAKEVRFELGITPYNGYTFSQVGIAQKQLERYGRTKIKSIWEIKL